MQICCCWCMNAMWSIYMYENGVGICFLIPELVLFSKLRMNAYIVVLNLERTSRISCWDSLFQTMSLWTLLLALPNMLISLWKPNQGLDLINACSFFDVFLFSMLRCWQMGFYSFCLNVSRASCLLLCMLCLCYTVISV